MANDEPPGRQRAVWIALGVSVVTALATGFALTTVLGVSDTLTGDISTALTRADPPRDPGMRIIVHGSPTGVGRGMQLALFGLLMGGIPSALLWRRWWRSTASQRGHRGPVSGHLCFSPGSCSN